MKRALFALSLFGLGASMLGAAAFGAAAKPPDQPVGAEVAFVQQVQKDLTSRFATPADAQKAGYFRYTNEDETGAISYANLQWDSADPQHPSQLWYDVNGRLLGADYSVPFTASNKTTPPSLWGVNPQRWFTFKRPHVHYILRAADSTMKYGLAVSGAAFTAAGGDLNNPQPATIVKMGKASNASQIAKVFTFPAMWDLELWVLPNPSGAFAEKNPNVHPSKNAASGDM
jgi:hypothetical protein